MESINNSNNINMELAAQQKKKQFQKIKKVLSKALKCINSKISNKKSKVEAESRTEVDDNDFNEMLERRMEEQQNLTNEQISGRQEEIASYCFVETEHGKFYWSNNINRFVAVDRDLIESNFCVSSFQQAQVQCC